MYGRKEEIRKNTNKNNVNTRVGMTCLGSGTRPGPHTPYSFPVEPAQHPPDTQQGIMLPDLSPVGSVGTEGAPWTNPDIKIEEKKRMR